MKKDEFDQSADEDFLKRKNCSFGKYQYLGGKSGGISKIISEKMSNFQELQQRKFIQKKLQSYGEEQRVLGMIFGSVFGFAFLMSGIEEGIVSSLPVGVFFGCSALLFYCGQKKKNSAGRMWQYYGILEKMGGAREVSVKKLSDLTMVKEGVLAGDLEEMISMGILRDVFFDKGNGVLVLEGVEKYLEGYKNKGRKENVGMENRGDRLWEEGRILREIGEVKISNGKIGKQVEHIGVIAGKILEFCEENPSEVGELVGFFQYYLPTTLKILRFYSQLEAQQIEGENISKSKVQIEEMMEKIVESFEKQLDQLFQNGVLDISADIQVLEQMLGKEGENVLKLD